MQFSRWIIQALRVTALLAVLVLPATRCIAQFNSTVEGTVSDPSGAVVPNAKVTLHNPQTDIDLHDTTQSSGIFRFIGAGK